MRNITGGPVVGDDLFGREFDVKRLWEKLDQGENILMVAPRRVGKTSIMKELHRVPTKGWDVIFLDLETGDSPEDSIAFLIGGLAIHPRYREWVSGIRFRKALVDAIKNITPNVRVDKIQVEFKGAMTGEWRHAAERLHERFGSLPDPSRKLLLIMDELPILISRMLAKPEGRSAVDLLMSWFRELRQDERLGGRVHFLIGGSIGLESILRRVALSAHSNDLVPFQIEPWDRATAVDFLERLGKGYNFVLRNVDIAQMLDFLGDLVPYHVQLFFDTVRTHCRFDSARITPEIIRSCFEQRLAGPQGSVHLDHYAGRLETMLPAEELTASRRILDHVCRQHDGAAISDILIDPSPEEERLYAGAIRLLEHDGYVSREGDKLRFRSNLVRIWWRRSQILKDE